VEKAGKLAGDTVNLGTVVKNRHVWRIKGGKGLGGDLKTRSNYAGESWVQQARGAG